MIQREAIVFSGKHQDKKQQRQTGRHAKKIAQLRFTLLLMSWWWQPVNRFFTCPRL